jgi:hypothetical protein
MDTLGSRCPFLLILGCLWGVSWVHIGGTFLIFVLIGSVKMGDRFQVHFFSDPGMEICQNAEAVCVRTIIETSVLKISHFFHVFVNLVSPGMGFRCHFCDFL